MSKSIKYLYRWPLCCLFFWVISCTEIKDGNLENSSVQKVDIREDIKKINNIRKIIQNGDIITRTGSDFTSESLRNLNRRNKTYSHCGIASIENDSVFVYHALGGEWNPDEKIIRDPFLNFCDPSNNKGVGIFRIKTDMKTVNEIKKSVLYFYETGVKFDMKFDLNTDDKMYCAEFVYKTIKKASGEKLLFPKSKIGNFEFIGIDDIFLHPLCNVESEIKFN